MRVIRPTYPGTRPFDIASALSLEAAIEEYKLIQQKKSKYALSVREHIVHRIQKAVKDRFVTEEELTLK